MTNPQLDPYLESGAPAYEVAMDYVENGIPVGMAVVRKPDGSQVLWTTVVPIMDEWVPKDDLDTLAGAIICIKRARDLAARHGFLVD